MRFLAFLLTSLGCLLLSSCFDIREEIWISANGTGRAELNYTVPSSAITLAGGEKGLREEVQRLFDSEPALKLDELSITPNGSDTLISLRASTDSMLSLIDLQENEAFSSLPDTALGFAGAFQVSLDGLTVNFDRRIDLQKALGLASLAISGDQRNKRQLRYVIHLPNQPETHNASEATDGGRTLIWNYTLGEALASPISTSFQAPIPIPWFLIAGVILLVVILLWAIAKVWRRKMSSRS